MQTRDVVLSYSTIKNDQLCFFFAFLDPVNPESGIIFFPVVKNPFNLGGKFSSRGKNKILSMAQQVFILGRLSSLLAIIPRVHNKPPELLFILIPHLVLKSQRH